MPAQTLESPDEHPVASAGRAMVGVRVDPPGRGVDRVGVLARSEMRQAMLAGPLFADQVRRMEAGGVVHHGPAAEAASLEDEDSEVLRDRKSTRLNSSHVSISYAVFCLKKKKKNIITFRLSTTICT